MSFLESQKSRFFHSRPVFSNFQQHEKAKLSSVSLPIGRLKFTVIRQKFRPVFPKITGKSKYAEFLYWKRINSMIDWCFNQKGIDKKGELIIDFLSIFCSAIRESCSIIYRFLREKREESKEVTAFTADITKCFSTLKHGVLIDILMDLIDQEWVFWKIPEKCGNLNI